MCAMPTRLYIHHNFQSKQKFNVRNSKFLPHEKHYHPTALLLKGLGFRGDKRRSDAELTCHLNEGDGWES
jgi:hypothetical protein